MVSTAALAKIYAADVKYLRLHEYNATDRTFTSKVGCDLPPLVERALVSHTGTLPIQITQVISFTPISPKIWDTQF